MASIENRSSFLVTVQNRGKLSQTFAYNRKKVLQAYISKLKVDGYKTNWSPISSLLEQFISSECERYIRHRGYCQAG